MTRLDQLIGRRQPRHACSDDNELLGVVRPSQILAARGPHCGLGQRKRGSQRALLQEITATEQDFHRGPQIATLNALITV